ncbi:ribosomal RNA small subunit methyltransferase A [Patescibacteria group bacterium]|nr:ribosomal RNA small subunit methyltransferase A [Patescibacteria group bacterium]
MEKKKSLGQHFLHSKHYLAKIADAAELAAGDLVLEVGPGEGALTRELLARGATVVAVEKDRRLIPVLKEKFSKEIGEEKLHIVEGDILRFAIAKFDVSKDGPLGYKVAANIPYYITGALLKKLLTGARQPMQMVLLLQKEVAERIACSKKESILSLSVKAYGDPTYVCTVPRGAFAPPPAVDSAVLVIKNISRAHFATAKQEERFFALVRAGFAKKRKLLARNLEPMLGKNYSHILQNIGISEKARAEDVHLEQWVRLSAIDLAGGD